MNDVERKIAKALKLSKGAGTAEEAQSAFLNAQRLAIQHGIDLEALGELPPAAQREIVYREVKSEGLSSWWREDLTRIIAKNFKCNWYRSFRGERGGKKFYAHMLVGFAEDIEIADAVHHHAEKAIMHHAREYIKKQGKRIKPENRPKYRDEYIRGFLDGLRWKFDQQVKANGWELAIIVDPILIEEVNKIPGMSKFTIQMPDFVSQTRAAYNTGHKQGSDYIYPAGSLKVGG
ncbi:DUF2786 domain-containing protein [Paenibacillus terreus]|uniref:DUF2786 domain-containing protein n=1 Tax=Paenibacillus terreus TaxID=1387834 RepID=UPI0035CCEE30